jgi:UDP-N-acetylmuramoyl-tripeptide--D-alanyl-D-alanine ligase
MAHFFSMETNILYQYFRKHPCICIDSRKVEPGALFFALKGDNFDGHQFAQTALDKGAAYAIVDRAEMVVSDQYLLVDSVLTALQQLASYHRHQFTIPVIGITGSNGKTTTKELVSRVLSTSYKIHYTKGNLNNHLGVPLTLLSMPDDTDIAVIEMGANHQGEIDALCQIASPTHGIITNIGKAHLEGFGGIEGVKKGKSELYRYLHQNDGVVFINLDAEFLSELCQSINHLIYYGQVEKKGSQHITMMDTQPFVSVNYLGREGTRVGVHSRLTGAYNFANIATAIAVGTHFGVPDALIKSAIESYEPDNMRSQIIHSGTNLFILDAYNANPSSTREAVINFSRLPGKKKIVILGDMLELGDYSYSEHLGILQLCLSLHFNQIVLVGPKFSEVAGETTSVLLFENVHQLKTWFEEQSFKDCSFLIKGSRGITLEKLLYAE